MNRFFQEIRLWVTAIRFYAHSGSLLPVALGSVYAWYVTEQFYWGRFLLALLAAALYHAGCNLINDYYDDITGRDRPGTYGGSGVLQRGEMSRRKMIAGIVVLFLLGSLVGLWLAWVSGPIILWLGLLGLLASIYYSVSKYSAKATALGEPVVFLVMGVAMTIGGYVVQTGTVTWPVVWISLPMSFLVTAILTANNIRDLADDRDSGIKTIAILFGTDRSRRVFDAIVFASYPIALLLVWARLAPWAILIVFLTLPMAFKLHRLVWRYRGEKHEELKDAPAETAKLHMAYNVLMSAGIWVGHWV
ncbi:MAG TPA: 1,4-dihydroxy-2-naphthoate octaprenyltransferase [Verrucomicrobia bacterium]|nr:MAG: 1,4-dihydroxy-2-naphthoate octaprenyltransferase [Lentisphaerae bacterium GWF2_57_35]HBA82796.1 1,4-dihydroxy-2-naphthoate octaprenyltransferase [Verrucomicrobiota bacterium]